MVYNITRIKEGSLGIEPLLKLNEKVTLILGSTLNLIQPVVILLKDRFKKKSVTNLLSSKKLSQ